MTENIQCPFCGEIHEVSTTSFGQLFSCSDDKHFFINASVFLGIDYSTKQRRLNTIYNFIIRKPFADENYRTIWSFYYDTNISKNVDKSFINVYELMKDYPYDVAEKIDKILLNLAMEYPSLSDTFKLQEMAEKKFRLLYCESKDRLMETSAIFGALSSCNYIELAAKIGTDVNSSEYRITLTGWKRVAELRKTNALSKQGFIAMSFDPQVKYIEDCFKKAISEVGYKPQIIKDKEHNNYIMPEIFYEIKQSRFVVVDITKPNYGAYYEAGYAQALGKEVIVCCKQEVFDNPDTKPHFDIAQKSMIIWKDEEDLIARLKNRIIATVNQ